MNQVTLIGRLGQNPESRAIQGGSMCNFSIATSESFKGRDGAKQERTEWHRCVAFGKLAEICIKYLSKGSQVLVQGKLHTRSWEDTEGNKRFQTEIVAGEVKFLDLKGPDDGEIPY